jgi:hypothetical protein
MFCSGGTGEEKDDKEEEETGAASGRTITKATMQHDDPKETALDT